MRKNNTLLLINFLQYLITCHLNRKTPGKMFGSKKSKNLLIVNVKIVTIEIDVKLLRDH